MPVLPVAFSLLGGVVSAISILGNAAEIYLYGTQLTVNLAGVLVGSLFIKMFYLPTLYNIELVSIMEYFQLRYSSNVLRKVITVCQLMSMSVYLGICLYAPSLAMSSVTPLPTWASILIMGCVCTAYVTVGGVRAVVYTDVVQTLLMFLGLVAVVAKSVADLGGFSTVWAAAERGHRLEFLNLDPSPFVRHTVWSTFSLGFYFAISGIGLNQAQFQRFSSVSSLKNCQRLLIIFTAGLIVLWSLFYFSGLVAYATFEDCDPLASGDIETGDQIIPYLVMQKLGAVPGMAGLFVAAVYGGVLSTLSSQANSMACLCWEDLLKDTSFGRSLSPAAAVKCVKILSAVCGIFVIGLAMVAGQLGSLFNVAYAVDGAMRGPVDGLFLAGLFIPWANKTGAMAGLLSSFSFSMWVVIGKLLRGGGSPPHLPLSTEGCNVLQDFTYLSNTSTLINTTSLVDTTTLFSVNNPVTDLAPTAAPESAGRSMYDVSYCYSGFVGIIITMVVCSLVSLCTGPLAPGQIAPKVVNGSCASLYRRVWLRWAPKDSSVQGSAQNKECSLPTIVTSHHQNSPDLSSEHTSIIA